MTCHCGKPLPTHRTGRPRSYCSTPCRRRAEDRACAVMGCERDWQYGCEGMCKAHYRKHLDSQPQWTMRDELLDWLSLEGTWSTAHEAAERFGRHVDSITRTLRILRVEGMVESRVMEMAWNEGGYDQRTEWRLCA